MKKYKRAAIFAGGGNRFAVYAGIYSALVDNNLTPDLILGSCGASLSATIISSFVDSKKIKEYLKSEELYSLFNNLKLTSERKFSKIPLFIILKSLFLRKNLYIEDIINKFLIDFPEDIENLLPNLNKEKQKIDTLIIGSKLNFDETAINKKIYAKNLYEEIIFTNIKDNLEINKISRSKAYINSIVSEEVEIIKDISLLKASRISMADMFLMSPVKYKDSYFAGGAIDLLPIEIADLLAEEIFLELKQSYNFIENSVVKFVLGYSGNTRFKEILTKQASYWIDTSDMPQYFKKFYNFLLFDIFKMQLKLNSLSYDEYCQDIDLQWDYGYNRVLESLKFEKNFKGHQRIKIK